MMRNVLSLVVIALALFSAQAKAQPATDPAIGPLRLGMTQAELRRIDSGVGGAPRDVAILLVPTRLSGILFASVVEFREQRVTRIHLGGGSSFTDAASCFAALERVLADVESRLGALDGAVSPWADSGEPTISPGGSRIYRQEGARPRAVAYRDGGDVISATATFGPAILRSRGDQGAAEECRLRVTLSRPLPRVTGEALATQVELDAAQPLENTRWLARPGGREFVAAYPALAAELGIEGRVVLDCLIVEQGGLRCLASSEQPDNVGFAPAALSLARAFRSDAEIDGVPTLGRRVQLPINFRLASE